MADKRFFRELERARAERQAKRDAVYVALWADPKYVRAHERKDHYNRDLSTVLAYPSHYTALDIARARRRFKASLRAIYAMERAAFERAGLTY
jgi:hypothetical protein